MTAPLPHYKFMAFRHLTGGLSVALVLASVLALATGGLHLGLDFTGGTLVELRFAQPVPLDQVRSELASTGFGNATAVHYGSERDVLVRLPAGPQDSQDAAVAVGLQGRDVEVVRSEFVGPQVGGDLRDQGGVALLGALALVTVYIALRFQFKFAVGAIVALFHDVLITLGAFSLFRWQFDLNVLAAVLTLVGYSINDTIVVFDRIRENLRKLRQVRPIDIIDISLTQTLERTVVTGGTTLLVLLGMLVLGGEYLRGFAIALTLGIVVGTYSSVYVAAYILLLLDIRSEDLVVTVASEADGG